jgi:hypothetical protein
MPMSHDETLEVISWDPEDHVDLPGFAHGLSRYGGHWFDISISVVPGEQDPLEALDKVFAKLRETLVSEIQHSDPASTLTTATTQFWGPVSQLGLQPLLLLTHYDECYT